MKRIIKRISFLMFFMAIFSCRDNHEDINSEVTVEHLKLSDLPTSIKVEGKPIEIIKWKDSLGYNLLVASKNGPFYEKITKETDDEKYIELFIDKYNVIDDVVKKEWRIYDFVRNCAYDMALGFPTKNSISITDLNNDGVTETTVAYFLVCRSDVSPSKLKTIMYNKGIKSALNGYTIVSPLNNINFDDFELNIQKIKIEDSYEGYRNTMGRYENEKDFINQDPKFLNHAKKIWKQNVIENEWIELTAEKNELKSTINKSNIDTEWIGNYTYETDFYKVDSLSKMAIFYEIILQKDSVTFSGQGYQTNFYDLCYAKQNADTLELYYNKSLEGTDYNKEEKGAIAKLFKNDNEFFIISPVFEDGENKKDIPILIKKESR